MPIATPTRPPSVPKLVYVANPCSWNCVVVVSVVVATWKYLLPKSVILHGDPLVIFDVEFDCPVYNYKIVRSGVSGKKRKKISCSKLRKQHIESKNKKVPHCTVPYRIDLSCLVFRAFSFLLYSRMTWGHIHQSYPFTYHVRELQGSYLMHLVYALYIVP